MTVSIPTLTVSFWDGGQPRPLADRAMAFAHQHARGWTLTFVEGGSSEHLTFEAVADAVARTTGVRRVLIAWPGKAVQ